MFCNDHDHSAMFIIIVKNGQLKASDHQFVQCVRSKEVPFEKLTCTVLVDCSYGIDGPFSSMMYLLKIAVVHSKLFKYKRVPQFSDRQGHFFGCRSFAKKSGGMMGSLLAKDG